MIDNSLYKRGPGLLHDFWSCCTPCLCVRITKLFNLFHLFHVVWLYIELSMYQIIDWIISNGLKKVIPWAAKISPQQLHNSPRLLSLAITKYFPEDYVLAEFKPYWKQHERFEVY